MPNSFPVRINKLSAAVVYTQLVISIIQPTNALDLLSLASSTVYPRTLDDEFPSWVPDFSHRATSSINSSFSSLRPVSADGDSVAITSFKDNFRTLNVRGFVIDSIDGLAQVLGTETSSRGNNLQQSRSKRTPRWPSEATRTIQVITQSLLAGPKKPRCLHCVSSACKKSQIASPKIIANLHRTMRSIVTKRLQDPQIGSTIIKTSWYLGSQ